MSSAILDLRTLSISFILVATFLSLLMIYNWCVHKTYPGFKLWTLSNFFIAVGFLLLSLRGAVPDFFSIVVANLFIIGGLLLAYEGHRKFLGLGNALSFSVTILVLEFFLLGIFTYIDNRVLHRIAIVSLFLAVIAARIALLFSCHFQPKYSFTSLFTVVIHIALCFLMVLRIFFTYAVSDDKNYYTPDWTQSLTYVACFAFIILWTFNYLILNNQRLQNELEDMRLEFERLAATDFLTGINNSRRFLEIGESEIKRARRFNHPLSVIMFDLDFFKNVNDTFGHAAGDTVLKKIVEICRKNIRSTDAVGRLGGEEFAILLPHTNLKGAKKVAEHLRLAIEKAEIESDSETIKITSSLGVTEIQETDKDIKETLARSDDALYQAKRNGRNRVFVSRHKKIRLASI